ncbi:hypothetical protein MKS88_002602 [Plasmodium brasilianum]|uniref:Uncharacterized protein n=1 Tax=Plasmodium brasilianum TaxID=5824 RepID=A0ACB9YC46_PLABR|nr:hypothetical protein MKS88_002602 [Plasmodium brasilianum]
MFFVIIRILYYCSFFPHKLYYTNKILYYEKILKLIFFVKTYVFIILAWIYNFKNVVSMFYKYLDENYDVNGKLYPITCLLLAIYKRGNRSNAIWIKELISSKGRASRRSEPCINSGGNLYCEKNIFEKLFYKNTVRYVMNDDFNFLKECIKVKLFGIFILGSFKVLVGIALLVLGKLGYMAKIDITLPLFGQTFLSTLVFLIFTLIIGAAMFYLHRMVVKYL